MLTLRYIICWQRYIQFKGSKALSVMAKSKTRFSEEKLLSVYYVLVPVECKIPRFVQFIEKDSSAGEANKTPGELL